ncbi:MAG: anti-sigma factor [Anaerolineales bacterium]
MSERAICSEIESMVPAYVLGALDSGEESFVTAHLSGCPACRAMALEYESMTEALLQAPPPRNPPAALRRRVEQAIEQPEAPMPELPEERWVRPTALRLAFSMGMVALIIVNLLLFRRVDSLIERQTELQTQVDRNQTAMAVLTYPTSKVAEVEGDSVFGTLVYDPPRQVAVLYAWGLKELPADRVYQAWLRDDSGGRVSAGLFQAQAGNQFSIIVLHSPAPIEQFVGLGVTIEPAGGSPGPSGDPVFSADL